MSTSNYTLVRDAIVKAVPCDLYERHSEAERVWNEGSRKIGLEDVLRWMNKPLSDERPYWYIVEDTGRIMRFWDYTTGDAEHCCEWKLGATLDQQPQPVIDFLASLLHILSPNS